MRYTYLNMLYEAYHWGGRSYQAESSTSIRIRVRHPDDMSVKCLR